MCLWQRRAGGAGAADEPRGISWATSAADGSCLTLHEWSLAGSVPAAALRLQFAAPLLPTAAAWSDDAGAVLYLLTADAVLHCLRLRRQDAHARQPLLHSLSAIGAPAISSIASPNAGALGRPTSLAAVAGAVCIGGSSGLVICVPLACFTGELPTQDAVQLAPSVDGLVTRIGRAFWGGSAMPGVVDLTPAPVLGPHMLAALYADTSLRFWDTKVGRVAVHGLQTMGNHDIGKIPSQHEQWCQQFRYIHARRHMSHWVFCRQQYLQPPLAVWQCCRPMAAVSHRWRRCGCGWRRLAHCGRRCWRYSCMAAMAAGRQPSRCSQCTLRGAQLVCNMPPPCR